MGLLQNEVFTWDIVKSQTDLTRILLKRRILRQPHFEKIRSSFVYNLYDLSCKREENVKQLKKAGKFLYSMKCAMILLVILVIACVAGSLIPQGEITSWYTSNYPEQAAGAVLLFGLDDVFHSGWFLVLTLFLCVNLLFCNVLHFPALIRKTKNAFTPDKYLAGKHHEILYFGNNPEGLFAKLGFHKVLRGEIAAPSTAVQDTDPQNNIDQNIPAPDSAIQNSDINLNHGKTEDRHVNEYLYAAKNKPGIWGAWLCHLGMLIIIAGFGLGQMLKTEYTVYGVSGQTKPIGDTAYELTIDDFQVNLREDQTVEQYTSHLTVTDTSTQASQSGEASVNAPLSLFGMKLYQNSTGWAATLEVWKGDEKLQEELLCAGEYTSVKDMEDLNVVLNAFYPDYWEDESGSPMTLSSFLKNPGYLYSIYYKNQMIGMNVLTGDDKITVDDYTFIFRDPQQYTLIQIKKDPFTWLTAIGGLIVLISLILAFYIQPRELCAEKQADGNWHVSCRSRKAGALFEEEVLREGRKEGGIQKLQEPLQTIQRT